MYTLQFGYLTTPRTLTKASLGNQGDWIITFGFKFTAASNSRSAGIFIAPSNATSRNRCYFTINIFLISQWYKMITNMLLFIQLPSSWILILYVKNYSPIEVIPTEEGAEILAFGNCHVVLNIAWRNGITSSHFRCRFLGPRVSVWRWGNSHRDLFCRCRS